jgi:Arc/MetJ-type ribon-helix-helix transcriptional regulator
MSKKQTKFNHKVTGYIDDELQQWLDKKIAEKYFGNRSHAVVWSLQLHKNKTDKKRSLL